MTIWDTYWHPLPAQYGTCSFVKYGTISFIKGRLTTLRYHEAILHRWIALFTAQIVKVQPNTNFLRPQPLAQLMVHAKTIANHSKGDGFEGGLKIGTVVRFKMWSQLITESEAIRWDKRRVMWQEVTRGTARPTSWRFLSAKLSASHTVCCPFSFIYF